MVKDPRQAGLEQIAKFRSELKKLHDADRGIADVVVLLCEVIAAASPTIGEALLDRIGDEHQQFGYHGLPGDRETFQGLLNAIERSLEKR